MGWREEGTSVYDLNNHGEPVDPDAGLDRWHEHDKYCEPGCDLDQWNEDYGNDTADEMRGRVQRAERDRMRGEHNRDNLAHLVQGDHVGSGHDGEPLLRNVHRVGDWMDHRHLFVPGAKPHRLARDEHDEGYEKPEGRLGHYRTAASDNSVVIELDVPQGLIHNVDDSVEYGTHVTVVYLGKGLDEAGFGEVLRRAEDAARRQPGPLTGTLSGLGTFEPSKSSDGKVPAYIPVNMPGIHVLHKRLEDLSASEHKGYIPHVTLAYCEPGGKLPPPHHEVPITFTHLTVRRGKDEAHRFPFGG
jgi:2'-5' RNA ligase